MEPGLLVEDSRCSPTSSWRALVAPVTRARLGAVGGKARSTMAAAAARSGRRSGYRRYRRDLQLPGLTEFGPGKGGARGHMRIPQKPSRLRYILGLAELKCKPSRLSTEPSSLPSGRQGTLNCTRQLFYTFITRPYHVWFLFPTLWDTNRSPRSFSIRIDHRAYGDHRRWCFRPPDT